MSAGQVLFVCLFILVTRPLVMRESPNTYSHWGPRDKPIGTLRVVTARELFVLSGSFTFHSVSDTVPPFTQPCMGASTLMLKGKNYTIISTSLSRNGPRAWAAAVTGAHATTTLVLLLLLLQPRRFKETL